MTDRTMTHPARRAGHGARLLLLGTMLTIPGCVVGQIHDEMVATNDVLTSVEQRLELIERANVLLDRGNGRLEEVQTRLERMESIDASLHSIDASLKHLDEHLASLRETIETIDSSIPFFNLEKKAGTSATGTGDETESSSVHVNSEE